MGDQRITWVHSASTVAVLQKLSNKYRLRSSGSKGDLVARLDKHKLIHNTAVATGVRCPSCLALGVEVEQRAPAAAAGAAPDAIDVDEEDAGAEAGGGGGGPPAASSFSSFSAAPPRAVDDEDVEEIMVRRPQRSAPARRPRARRCRRALDRAHFRAHARARGSSAPPERAD